MKLDVLPSAPAKPWYADGLKFTCSQCGNCCTGGPGYVWISTEEIARLAEFLNLTVEQTVERYCRKVEGRFSLKEVRREGLYDCIFLKEIPPDRAPAKGKVVHIKRGCSIYPARPLQCRTWPFWDGNLASKDDWARASRKCPGIGHGRKFSLPQIERIRNATDWPQRPPSSGTR